MTALARATAEEDADSVHVLLAAGANPLVPSRAGWTPAFTAKYHDKQDLIDFYRDAGVTDWEMHPYR